MPKNRETITNNYTNAKKRRSSRNIHLCFVIRHFLRFDYPSYYGPFEPGYLLA